MRIVLSGGGTAGHINPALALAEVLQDQGHEVLFAGTPQGVEARLVKEAGIPFKPFTMTGFDRSHPTTLVRMLALAGKSTAEAKRWLSKLKPDVVVGFGGYVSIPVGRAARKCKIPLVVHEQNSVMGLANKYLAKHAQAVAVTYEISGVALPKASNVVLTGNPVRKTIIEATREQGRKLLGIPEEAEMLLIFGGSLGARHINSAIVDLKESLMGYDRLFVVQVTGPREYDAVQNALSLGEEEADRWKLFGYHDRMGEVLAAADMVVARAGATSLAEISARKLPALLVPFPFATEDHQTTNAKAYVEQGCAWMVADSELDSEAFARLLFELIEDRSAREKMRVAAAGLDTEDAAANLAEVVIGAARQQRP